MITKFVISPAARAALDDFREIAQRGIDSPIEIEHVLSMSWGTVPGPGVSRVIVGYYTRAKINYSPTLILDGIEFYVDDLWHEGLEGKTLDYFSGSFEVM